MNIAIFSPSQNPYSETFILAHKNHLKGNIYYYYGIGININLEGESDLLLQNERLYLKIKKTILRKPQNYLHQIKILRSLKKNRIDVVLVEYGTHASNLLPLLKTAALPLVVHFHGYDASIKNVIKSNNYYKAIFEYANFIVVVSNKMQGMISEMGCPIEKIVLNTYGPQPAFEKINCNFSKQQFIGIGRFTDKKAPYYTILAFKMVLDQYPKARLLLAGEGALLNTCKNLVKYLGLNKNVQFLGIITPEEYQNILKESLAFVQHSITADSGDMEGTPLAILEASVAGLPVISTYHAGIPDVIKHQETGLLSGEHDVDGMARNMMSLLEDISIAKSYGKNGKKYILENYSMAKHIAKLEETLSVAFTGRNTLNS
jgi:glycosyltransferase involved in cell wall biosynthesis